MLCSGYCFKYSINISSKVDIKFILWCFILMDCSCFFLIHPKINEWLWLSDYLAFVGILCMKLCSSLSIWLHCPVVYVLFQPSTWFKYWFYISSLVKFICERSLSRKKSQFLSKVVFVVTLRLPSTTFDAFWVLTNWRHCRGWKCK